MCPGFNHITFIFNENSNYGRESFIRQNIAGWCQQTFCFQKFVDNAQQCFAFTPQANFPAHNLNFHWMWRWWDRIQAIFLNLFYFNGKDHMYSKVPNKCEAQITVMHHDGGNNLKSDNRVGPNNGVSTIICKILISV